MASARAAWTPIAYCRICGEWIDLHCFFKKKQLLVVRIATNNKKIFKKMMTDPTVVFFLIDLI